jgi:hypothetical protein
MQVIRLDEFLRIARICEVMYLWCVHKKAMLERAYGAFLTCINKNTAAFTAVLNSNAPQARSYNLFQHPGWNILLQ